MLPDVLHLHVTAFPCIGILRNHWFVACVCLCRFKPQMQTRERMAEFCTGSLLVSAAVRQVFFSRWSPHIILLQRKLWPNRSLEKNIPLHNTCVFSGWMFHFVSSILSKRTQCTWWESLQKVKIPGMTDSLNRSIYIARNWNWKYTSCLTHTYCDMI